MTQSDSELSPDHRQLIGRAAERLRREFEGVFAPPTIERLIRDSLDELSAGATVTTWLPVLTERFARDRLRAPARVEGLTDNHRPAVLFLCVHNAGRSQMAAGWMRHLAGNRVDVFSGGSEPAAEVNPAAVEAMEEVGIDIRTDFPKPWTDEIVRAADVVVTMGCGDACPVFPGRRYLDWELTDPAGQPIEVVRTLCNDIEGRVRALLVELDVPVTA